MCSVEVLLLTDVMRRESSAPRNVCRKLFAADGEGSEVERRTRFLTAVQRDLEQRDRERWNFDFVAGKPLPGRYHWVPLATQSEKAPCPRRTHKATTQSKITDFLLQRKRHRTSDECPALTLKARRLEQQQQSAAVN